MFLTDPFHPHGVGLGAVTCRNYCGLLFFEKGCCAVWWLCTDVSDEPKVWCLFNPTSLIQIMWKTN